MAFNAKNLSYQGKEPAFLRRLKGDLSTGDADRHERPIARPKRLKQDDDDDAPTYVVEESNDTLSKAEYDALVNGTAEPSPAAKQDGGDADAANDPAAREADLVKSKQQVASVGAASKKRKAVKVVGADDADGGGEDAKPKKQKKKKAKPVKLSFGDDEEKT